MKHIWAFAALLPLVVTGCTAEWMLPSGYVLTCTESSDCPGDQTCNSELGVCLDPNQPICGNGQTEFGEDCDIGTEATTLCEYGNEECIVCVGLDYESLADKAISELAPCSFGRIKGSYCGDGVVQQRGLIDGTTLYSGTLTDGKDTGEWEGCDPGFGQNLTPSVTCSSLHPALGDGTARCDKECVKYDTSDCSNQSVVFVPAGPFMMGCNEAFDGVCDADEIPYHEVYLDAYVIDKTEVVAGVYRSWCEATADCDYKNNHPTYLETIEWYAQYQTYLNNRDDHPINVMSYDDAVAFCAAQDMRLPSEAEWEKAARGTDGRVFPWGLAIPTCARAVLSGWSYDASDGWIEGWGCGKDRTWAAGSMNEGMSPYGAQDMSGNLWEWVSDWYGSDFYAETSLESPEGPVDGVYRVLRGGAFDSNAADLRASNRLFYIPSFRGYFTGFRCAY